MTFNKKIVLGLAAFFPFIYGFFIIALALVFDLTEHAGKFVAIHIIAMLVMMATLGFYVMHVIINKRLPANLKIIWAVVVILMGPIGMIIYWHQTIWKDLPPLRQ